MASDDKLNQIADELFPKEPGLIETGLRGVARGTLGVYSGVGSAAEWAGDVSRSQGLRSFGTTLQDLANDEIQTGVGALNGPSFEGSFTENPSLKRTVGVVAQAVPSLGLAVATGGAATAGLRAAGLGLKAAQVGGAATAATGLGGIEGAPQYSEARKAGKSIGEASAVGAAATIGTALLEYLPIGKILGEASKGAVRTGLTGAVTEGLQEGTQTVWQNLVAKLGYDQSRSLAEGMVESMVGGAGAGGVVGGITGHVQQARDTATARTLETLMPEGAQVSVDNGMATVQAAGRSFQSPVRNVATALASGVSFDDLADAHTTLLDEVTTYLDAQQRQATASTVATVDEAVQEQADTAQAVTPPIDMEQYARDLKQRNAAVQDQAFESLRQLRVKPQFVEATDQGLTYTEQGAPVTYTPLEGQTVAQLQEKIAGMPDAQAVAYLKQNASLVQQEEPTFSRKVTDIKGNKVEAPTVFYRGEREGGDRSVSGNAVWDSLLFASSDKSGADLYAGSAGTVTELRAKPETKILYEGTKEFRSLNKGNTFGGPKGKNLLDWAAETAYRAKEQGYDAVWFKRQSDVGTAIINRSAFEGEADLNFMREGVTQSPATLGTEIDTPEIQALTKGIGAYLGTTIAPGTFAQAETPEAMKRLTPLLEIRLGKKIVYFTAKDAPMQIAGVTGISDDIIYINADTKVPHLAVVGHEFLHELKRSDEATYSGILQAVQKIMPQSQFDRMQASLDSARSAEGKGNTSQTLVHEELTADYFGEQFMTKQFWEKAQRNNPQQFVSLAQKFVQFVQKIKDTFTGKQLTDIEKAQDVAAAALRKYAKKNGLDSDPRFMLAWHGSPHDHNKFDSSKIGTGEGAQAYGHGHYFSSRKEVAEWYKDRLSLVGATIIVDGDKSFDPTATGAILRIAENLYPDNQKSDGALSVLDAFRTNGFDWANTKSDIEAWADNSFKREALSVFDDVKERVKVEGFGQGRLYEVELAPNEDELLDWDKPLSEQSDKVREALGIKSEASLKDYYAFLDSLIKKYQTQRFRAKANSKELDTLTMLREKADQNGRQEDIAGSVFYEKTSDKKGSQQAASEYLHSLGIRGIKYLDGSSRSQGEGNHNYVIFSDEDVSIKAKFSRMDEAGATTDKQRAEAKRLWQEKGTESPYFKKWFGDSKVVDEKGKPLVVYHGTSADISAFDQFSLGINTEAKSAKGAFFFSSSPVVATGYAALAPTRQSLDADKVRKAAKTGMFTDETTAFLNSEAGKMEISDEAMEDGELFMSSGFVGKSNVLPVYISMQNPFVVDFASDDYGDRSFSEAIKLAQARGHDGVIFKNANDSYHKDYAEVSGIYAVFSPTQIKSATGNQGTFDATNPDITFSRMDEAGATTDKQRAEAKRLWQEKGTDSPYFKKWFGDSKVVDENGKPLVMYHGTGNEIESFDRNRIKLGLGFFFTKKKSVAKGYADRYVGRGKGNVLSVYLNIRNPIRLETEAGRRVNEEIKAVMPADARGDAYKEAFVREAQSRGYDGMTMLEGVEYVAFSPEQIKSATSNQGTFDATDPRITFSRMDAALKQGQQQLERAAKAALNPKDKLHQLMVEHAPKWLSVMPLQTTVELFGKKVTQLKSIYDRLNQTVTIKNDLIDVAYVLRDEAHKLASKTVGLETFNKAAELGTFNRMLPWEDIYAQEWVPATGTKQQRLQKAQEAWVAAGMQKATKLTFVQAYAESREAYDALKHDELKQAYKSAVDYMKNIRNRERDNLLAYIESVSDEGTALRKQLMQRFEASFTDIQGAYWPLSRFGDFTLSFTDTNGFRIFKTFPTYAEALQVKDALIAGGEVEAGNINVSRKDEKTAAETAIPNALMSQLMDAVQAKYTEGINAEDEVAYDNALLRAQSTVQEMNQIWLRWQPETSALKNSMRRGNVKGYDQDMLRGFLNYVQHHASRIAWSEQGRKIEQDMQEMAAEVSELGKGEGATDTALQQAILNDMRQRLQTLKTAKVGWAASSLGKLGTAYFMTSPSIALVQMSQLAVLTLPKLATMYSVKGATTALSKGTVQALSQQYSRDAMFADADVNRLYDMMREAVSQQTRQEGQRIGEPRYTQAHIKAEIAKLTPEQQRLLALREAMARNLLDISATHEAYELTQGKNPDSPLRKAFYYAMAPMRLSELASRKTAVLATFELATEQGKDFFGAMNDIAEVVNDTLYSYAKENKGWRMQGGLARVLLMFRHYQIMTAIRMGMLFKDSIKGESAEVRSLARREFAGIMGMTGLLAGSLGLPLSQTIFAILDMVLGDDDEPMDSQLEFTNWLNATLGETAGNVAAKGLPTLVGMDLSRRIGLQDIYGMGQDAPAQLHGSSLAAWHAAHMLGPSYSVFEGWFKGYDQMMNKGNYLRGLEEATPKPIRDMLKAYRTATEGVKTTSGKRLVADEDMGVDEIISMALGFYPDELAKAQANQNALLNMSTRISERRGKLIRQAARAIMEGGDPMEAYEGIRTFNSKMPRFKISSGDVRSAIKARSKGELGTTGVRERAVAQQYGIDALGVE